MAAENEIIEEFEPEDEDNREEGEEAEEPRGLRAPLKVSKEERDAHGRNAPHRTRIEEQREDDERMNWRLAEKMEKILKEKQETAETIEQEPEEDCRVGKRPMEQQQEGPERRRVQVSVEDALAQWGEECRERETRTAGDQGGAGRAQETERECTRGERSCPWTFP